MAKKKEEAEAPVEAGEEGEKKKGGKKKKIIMILVPLVLLGGGYMFLGGGSAPKKLKPGETTTTVKPAELGIAQLDAVTVSIGDGNFVKVQVGFEIIAKTPDKGETVPEYAKVPPFDNDTFKATYGIKAQDAISSTLEKYTVDDIRGAEGRDKIKEEIAQKIVKAYNGWVGEVYFGEFTWQ